MICFLINLVFTSRNTVSSVHSRCLIVPYSSFTLFSFKVNAISLEPTLSERTDRTRFCTGFKPKRYISPEQGIQFLQKLAVYRVLLDCKTVRIFASIQLHASS